MKNSNKNYRVIFSDLDGTLINTESGCTFPKGIWDMKFNLKALDKIKEYNPEALVIVTNQGGISAGFLKLKSFQKKMMYIQACIEDYTGVIVNWQFCASNDKEVVYRKPNVGMLEYGLRQIKKENGIKDVNKEDCLMIGDASGKEGQFSDSDKKTAENFGIDYLDINDFVE